MSAAPSGLVHNTNNSSQSYTETEEMLTYDEIIECDTENFAEYLDVLEEKAILLRDKEDPSRGLIVKPCNSSRYFVGGKRKARGNIKKRFGKYYNAPGTFATLTYDHERYSRWEAWERLPNDIRRFKHNITMRYKRVGRTSPKYICVIEEQSKTGYPHVHFFYPRLRWLLKKEDVEALWGVGRTRVEYAKSVNIGRYVCKYITKMGGWSAEALAFIWKRKMRLYSYSRSYKLPDEDKQPSKWAYTTTLTRGQIESRLDKLLTAMPNIENIVDYLEDKPEVPLVEGLAQRRQRRALIRLRYKKEKA